MKQVLIKSDPVRVKIPDVPNADKELKRRMKELQDYKGER